MNGINLVFDFEIPEAGLFLGWTFQFLKLLLQGMYLTEQSLWVVQEEAFILSKTMINRASKDNNDEAINESHFHHFSFAL